MAGINAQPPVLDLSLYAGDGINFRLIVKDESGAPIDITGEIEAQIRVNRTPENSLVEYFNADMIQASDGIIVLSLNGDQTQALMEDPSAQAKNKFVGVWDVQWTSDSAQPRTLCQGKVECEADVTR